MAEFCSALVVAEILPARHRARHHDSGVQLILFCPVLAGDAIQPLRGRHNFHGILASREITRSPYWQGSASHQRGIRMSGLWTDNRLDDAVAARDLLLERGGRLL
jgi:hypothetical protein